jgi:hypothetical protein
MMNGTYYFFKASIIVPHSLTRWTPEAKMEDLLRAQWKEHLVEQRLQSVEESMRPTQQPFLDAPLQNQLMEGKLSRAMLEVQLYSEALAKAAKFRNRHPTCVAFEYF